MILEGENLLFIKTFEVGSDVFRNGFKSAIGMTNAISSKWLYRDQSSEVLKIDVHRYTNLAALYLAIKAKGCTPMM